MSRSLPHSTDPPLQKSHLTQRPSADYNPGRSTMNCRTSITVTMKRHQEGASATCRWAKARGFGVVEVFV